MGWLLSVLGLGAFWALSIGEDQDPVPPARAHIVNDEGGVVSVSGRVAYTNAFFTSGVDDPLIILEDQTGFVRRDRNYIFPIASQTMGQITTDFYTSPFRYTLALPIEPSAPLNDVDNNGRRDTGVMIFAVAYWNNAWGDAFLEERDQFGGGWSTAYVSTLVSKGAQTRGEYVGGKLLIYAPEDGQGFPVGWGDDGKLFTADDPIVVVPKGWTLVNMDTQPFTFDRSRRVTVDLLEGEGARADDFSRLSYTEAFDAMIEKFRREYAFSEYKGLDWDALKRTYRPRFEEAQRANNFDLYASALLEFALAIPDGHVSASYTQYTYEQFVRATEGGLGLALTELDDGRMLVSYVGADTPAEAAGIARGAELLTLNGMPISTAVARARLWSNASSPHYLRLQQVRYATRFPVGAVVDVTFRNPNADPQSARLIAVREDASLNASQLARLRDSFALPLTYTLLDEGVMYVKINSFFDDKRLTVALWERMIKTAKAQNVPAMVLDLRTNTGGSGYLADQMAAYFFDESLLLGNTGFYDAELGTFYFDPEREERFILPPDALRYRGRVAVLISPSCLSACEFFAWNMTLRNRAEIVGHYPTGGLGGSVQRFYMPHRLEVQLTVGRAVDNDGHIHIEGVGVAPTLRVPVTEETVFARDALLDAALGLLSRH